VRTLALDPDHRAQRATWRGMIESSLEFHQQHVSPSQCQRCTLDASNGWRGWQLAANQPARRTHSTFGEVKTTRRRLCD
jgi:hypothetical protein